MGVELSEFVVLVHMQRGSSFSRLIASPWRSLGLVHLADDPFLLPTISGDDISVTALAVSPVCSVLWVFRTSLH